MIFCDIPSAQTRFEAGRNMTEDHLGKETSVSVDLTGSGVTAKARSRFVAAIDRLCGNAVDVLNIPLERRASKGHATIEGEKKLIEAAIAYRIERMGHDPVFAERVIEKQIGNIFRKQENKDAVVATAIEDLRNDPIAPQDANAGSAELDSGFLDRFERFAEDATDAQLRQKWGRVLAAETRKPGTFSMKVLRIVDELDASTALAFENLCKSRLATFVPKCLSGKVEFPEETALTTAGLIIDPAMGHRSSFNLVDQAGGANWVLGFDRFALAIPVGSPMELERSLGANETAVLLAGPKQIPSISVYILTVEGDAVAKILPNCQQQAFGRLVEKVKILAPHVQAYERHVQGQFEPFKL
jgi:Protein of unknown function (DUF2806)